MGSPIFRRVIALPQDHGSWVFLLSPLLIGLFAGKEFNTGSVFLILGAIAGFLIRHPITILIKITSHRRSERDYPAAFFWTATYALIGVLAVLALIRLGYTYVLYLAAPGLPVFAWHLWLVSRRSERRQIGIEVVASGVLALAAPAAFWVGEGSYDPIGWWLFGLTWFQSAASIVYAYLRLEQRELIDRPPTSELFKMAHRALAYTSFNLIGVAVLSGLAFLPRWLFIPYALQWAETIWGTLQPAIRYKPTRIGIRQLLVSTLFTILFIITWG